MATIDAEKIVQRGRAAFRAGKTRSYEARIEHLKNIQRMIVERRQDFIDAVYEDLRKPSFETNGFEIMMSEGDIIEFLDELENWIKPMHIPIKLMTLGKVAYNVWEPLGLSLIIGAWNYPVQLIMEPLVAAIVAGNTAIIKPSELSPATAKVFATVVPQYLDQDCYQVVTGDAVVTTSLLEQRFDHILYTGSGNVAKIVMTAAAKHLTPVTLELGGKSPCYIDEDSDLETSVRRAVWGRFMNCGQTCIAPDYIICHPSLNDRVVSLIRRTLNDFFGADPQKHNDYARIVNQRHFKRVMGLLEGQNVVIGGTSDESDLYIAPSVILNPQPDAKCMTEEIFGPVFPIFNVNSLDEAINFINDREKPLSLYAFSNNVKVLKRIAGETSSGAFVGNDCVVHAAVQGMPFGGVGASGMGAYHGRFSFETFSHKKPVLIDSRTWLSEKLQSIRYPPYTDHKTALTQWFMKRSSKKGGLFSTLLKLSLLGFFIAVICKALGVDQYLPRSLRN